MEKNRLVFKLGIIIISIFFIFSVVFSNYIKLDMPVFLENYREMYLYKNENEIYLDRNFIINYITNSSDKRVVTDIYIPNMPSIDFNVSEYDRFAGGWSFLNENTFTGKIIGRYSFRTVYGDVLFINEDMEDNIEIENLIINFDNGDVMNVNIGKIIIKDYKNDSEYLERSGTGGSSSGKAYSDYLVLKDITLEKLYSPFLDEIESNIEIKLNNIDYKNIYGTEFKSGDRFNITSTFTMPEDMRLKYMNIQIDMDLYFKDEEGTRHKIKSHYIFREPRFHDFNFWDLISYLKLRRAI